MATEQQIHDLRVMIDEPTQATYTDLDLSTRIDTSSSPQFLASLIWSENAAVYSGLVDVQEGSSRRSLGQLQANALKMASHYRGVSEEGAPGSSFRPARTRQIERP